MDGLHIGDGEQIERDAVHALGLVLALVHATHEGHGLVVDEVDGDEDDPPDMGHAASAEDEVGAAEFA